MTFELKECVGESRHTDLECLAFVEGYCYGKSISTQQLANSVDHFDIVLDLYDKYKIEMDKDKI